MNLPHHVLTIDLEEWFHGLLPEGTSWMGFERRVEKNTRHLLDILDHHEARATFFVLGDVARHSPKLIQHIIERGHELGSHGMFHQLITRHSPDEFRLDLRQSLEVLEDIGGKRVTSYRAPYFSITAKSLWALDILAEEGIRCDSSIFPIRNHRYGIPKAVRIPHEIRPGLFEWPISTIPSPLGNLPFSGGVYFRFLPLQMVEFGIMHLEQRGEPVVVYLHPWELDPDHPRYFAGAWFLHLRHYCRLRDTERRLARILSLAHYTGLEEANNFL